VISKVISKVIGVVLNKCAAGDQKVVSVDLV